MSLNESSLEKKLSSVTNSQDSIQSLSLWILHHKSHYKRIIEIWIQVFEKVKASSRLTLIYLANDVIQHAKRKGFPQFVDHFFDALKRATTLCKDDKISASVERVFDIWLERNIYTEEGIEELRGLLSGTSVHLAAVSRIVAEFKLSELIDKIKRCKKSEQLSASKLESLGNCKVDATSGEVLNKLKDKTHGEQFSKDFDDATKCLESVISVLEKEIQIRSELIESLERSEVFYETQKEEAKTVVDAYKNFGLRVKNVGRKLDESRHSLPSPLPSPPRDAPSPTNSDDGPNLPQTVLAPEVNALLRQVVGNDSMGVNSTTSSLDRRLSSLMQNIPHMNDSQNSSSNHMMTQNNNKMQNISNNSIFSENNGNNYGNNNWIHNQMNDSTLSASYANESVYSSHQTNLIPNHNQYMYDYNYTQLMPDIAQPNSADIQHIQPLVSSRVSQVGPQIPLLSAPQMAPNLMPPFHDYAVIPQPSENFEPADMDLGNSDEEESNINRSQTHRTIKVIETRRNSNENPLNDFNVNNNSNNDRLYANNNNIMNSNPSVNNRPYMPPFPQLKSVARMPVRSSMNSQPSHPYSHSSHPSVQSNQWRTPRSAVVSAQHFSPMNAPVVSHNRNHQNWRSHNNRNNRKPRY